LNPGTFSYLVSTGGFIMPRDTESRLQAFAAADRRPRHRTADRYVIEPESINLRAVAACLEPLDDAVATLERMLRHWPNR
jgi:hypothetical protein